MTLTAVPDQFSAPNEVRIPAFPIQTEITCDEWEPRKDSEPAIVPSVLFDEETVRAINWKAVFGF